MKIIQRLFWVLFHAIALFQAPPLLTARFRVITVCRLDGLFENFFLNTFAVQITPVQFEHGVCVLEERGLQEPFIRLHGITFSMDHAHFVLCLIVAQLGGHSVVHGACRLILWEPALAGRESFGELKVLLGFACQLAVRVLSHFESVAFTPRTCVCVLLLARVKSIVTYIHHDTLSARFVPYCLADVL